MPSVLPHPLLPGETAGKALAQVPLSLSPSDPVLRCGPDTCHNEGGPWKYAEGRVGHRPLYRKCAERANPEAEVE